MPTWVKTTGMAGLVLLNVVLLAMLVLWMRDTSVTATPDDDVAVSSGEGPSGEPTGSVTLVSAGDGVVARVTKGTCTAVGRPMLEISEDNGAQFEEVELPKEEVRTLLRVDLRSAEDFTIIGGDAGCDTAAFSTEDAGEEWTPEDPDGWYVDAAEDGVIAPGGPTQPGCSVLALESTGDSGRVICVSGVVRASDDGGLTWTDRGLLEGISAAAFVGDGDAFGVAETAQCASQVYSSEDDGATWESVGCVDEDRRVSGLTASEDIIVAGNAAGVRVSTDGGETWELP